MRALLLRTLMATYRAGAVLLTAVRFLAGGFAVALVRSARAGRDTGGTPVPLALEASRWSSFLLNYLTEWLHSPPARDPDVQIGPVLSPRDCPQLVGEIHKLAGLLGTTAPPEMRITYLPCCGVLEVRRGPFRRRRVLVVGLPLIEVLSAEQLRAVLAHELAHTLGPGLAAISRTARFLEGLQHRLRVAGRRPLGVFNLSYLWAVPFAAMCARLASPAAYANELEADRQAAAVCGGSVLSDALATVALAQPVFREVLAVFDPLAAGDNLYRVFAALWEALPQEHRTTMAREIVAGGRAQRSALHPPLGERLRRLEESAAQAALGNGKAARCTNATPPNPPLVSGGARASAWLRDLELWRTMLHNRIYLSPNLRAGRIELEPSIFSPAPGPPARVE